METAISCNIAMHSLNYNFRATPRQTKVLVCALGLLLFVLDMSVPATLAVAIFYCFAIALCAWTRSFVFLWSAVAVFAIAIFAGLLFTPLPTTGAVSWVDWSNRIFTLGALLLVATVIDIRMRGLHSLESATAARKLAEKALRDSEERLRLAQLAAHVGSWDWAPAGDIYEWAEECYSLFGLEPDEKSFRLKWESAIDPGDLSTFRDAMAKCAEGDEFEVEYRYSHPQQGLRWIYTKAKMLVHDSNALRLYGIFQDVTVRKQLEELQRQSHSVLEARVDQRTAQLRKLSADLLRAQDEERRKISRELHDSFGQYLASLKINLDVLAGLRDASNLQAEKRAELISDSCDMVEQCILETRTLSHLLHPPLLDEAGFASAARWYVEGFARRSGLQVNLELPPQLPRLAPAVELAFFRALQESITNIHRYSGSLKIDIRLETDAEGISLEVRDYGCGIPVEIIKTIIEGTGGGVGLAAMRERMSELGGRLEVSSDGNGTLVRAWVPVSAFNEAPLSTARVA
jgi:signal transduction histidine kinase